MEELVVLHAPIPRVPVSILHRLTMDTYGITSFSTALIVLPCLTLFPEWTPTTFVNVLLDISIRPSPIPSGAPALTLRAPTSTIMSAPTAPHSLLPPLPLYQPASLVTSPRDFTYSGLMIRAFNALEWLAQRARPLPQAASVQQESGTIRASNA